MNFLTSQWGAIWKLHWLLLHSFLFNDDSMIYIYLISHQLSELFSSYDTLNFSWSNNLCTYLHKIYIQIHSGRITIYLFKFSATLSIFQMCNMWQKKIKWTIWIKKNLLVIERKSKCIFQMDKERASYRSFLIGFIL